MDEDIIQHLQLVEFKLSKPELSAFFRKRDDNRYRECKDQILRNFLKSLQGKYREGGGKEKGGGEGKDKEGREKN